MNGCSISFEWICRCYSNWWRKKMAFQVMYQWKNVIVHKSIAEIRVNTATIWLKFYFLQPNQPNQYVPCQFFSLWVYFSSSDYAGQQYWKELTRTHLWWVYNLNPWKRLYSFRLYGIYHCYPLIIKKCF